MYTKSYKNYKTHIYYMLRIYKCSYDSTFEDLKIITIDKFPNIFLSIALY